jgi:uncharacterized tellurite resistance protein B-like protein
MNFFSTSKSNENFKTLETSITTLFIHAARLDENYSDSEKKKIILCLKKLGITDDIYIGHLISKCEELEKNNNQILHLTQEIKKIEYPDRLKIIEMLIEIIYADQKLDEFEDNLIRRVAGLTYINHTDIGSIKMKIKKKLGLL